VTWLDNVRAWTPDNDEKYPQGMPEILRPSFDSYYRIIHESKEPGNLAEIRLAHMKALVGRFFDQIADEEDYCEGSEVLWCGAMMILSALRSRPTEGDEKYPDRVEELEAFEAEVEMTSLSFILHRVYEWTTGKEWEYDDE